MSQGMGTTIRLYLHTQNEQLVLEVVNIWFSLAMLTGQILELWAVIVTCCINMLNWDGCSRTQVLTLQKRVSQAIQNNFEWFVLQISKTVITEKDGFFKVALTDCE